MAAKWKEQTPFNWQVWKQQAVKMIGKDKNLYHEGSKREKRKGNLHETNIKSAQQRKKVSEERIKETEALKTLDSLVFEKKHNPTLDVKKN